MDTKTLISEAKARFNHNSAKAQLKDKYDSKLIVADQNGLWRADAQTITILATLETEYVVLIDRFDNPVRVNRSELLIKLASIYNSVMTEWHTEWKELESKR